jgi:hypothetical protein
MTGISASPRYGSPGVGVKGRAVARPGSWGRIPEIDALYTDMGVACAT